MLYIGIARHCVEDVLEASEAEYRGSGGRMSESERDSRALELPCRAMFKICAPKRGAWLRLLNIACSDFKC